MSQLLFDRSTGILPWKAFVRAHTTQRIHSFQLAPRLRFNGGEKVFLSEEDNSATADTLTPKIWAHQAGVNALALDIDNRM